MRLCKSAQPGSSQGCESEAPSAQVGVLASRLKNLSHDCSSFGSSPWSEYGSIHGAGKAALVEWWFFQLKGDPDPPEGDIRSYSMISCTSAVIKTLIGVLCLGQIT